MMTIEEQLKAIILERYKSVRAFTTSIGVPYTTLDSVFKRGVGKAGIETMLKVFDALDLDVESITSGTLKAKNASVSINIDTEANPVDIQSLYSVLLENGFVTAGQDLSDKDLHFLMSVGELLRAWFAKSE